MANWTKPAKGVHVFVVLRHDDFIGDPVDAIMGTKGYSTLERAEAEADRLNGINTDKGCRYFVRVARFVEDPSQIVSDADAS
jgi:hypothetical protein